MKINELLNENKQLERLGEKFLETLKTSSIKEALALLDNHTESKYGIKIPWDEEAIEYAPEDFFVTDFEPLCAYIERALNTAKISNFKELVPVLTIHELSKKRTAELTTKFDEWGFGFAMLSRAVVVLNMGRPLSQYLRTWPVYCNKQAKEFEKQAATMDNPVVISWTTSSDYTFTAFKRK